ncbi:MAG: glutathione S-transferase [Hyphomicrobiales bacterium]|nr:glutathione S-transferase [Hyphomicrobiales bacterium]
MKFYDCSTAPSPRLVRMFIAEKQLEIETVQVDLRDGEHLGDAFRDINPYCTVPVIETDDGEHFTSTQGCWRYLEEQFPDPPLLGTSPAEKARIADLVWRIEIDGFLAAGEALRNTAPGLKNRALTGPVNYAQIPELGERGKARAQHFLDNFEALLSGNEFLAGEKFSAADIMALAAIDFAGWIKLKLPAEATNAQRWYQAVSARPSASQ